MQLFLPQASPPATKPTDLTAAYEQAARRVNNRLHALRPQNATHQQQHTKPSAPQPHLAAPLIPYGVLAPRLAPAPKRHDNHHAHARTAAAEPARAVKPKPPAQQRTKRAPKPKPRARFPTHFPSRVADGVSEAQVLVLGDDGRHLLPPRSPLS